ncbi:MAG: glutathione S-transferase [Kofleriaceae bacterium]|nr:MAG: glutathione S-transferase [Kofleriaceae bacterium]MBZ0234315.1 glutathione S-transferase [Kofleriaceae bacterium]
MKLYGTTTSPFVRRVRVVAAEVGAPYELVNTAPADGQAALRAISPIWKVPVAELGERIIYDSRVIIDWLTTFRGWGDLRPPRDRWREANLLNAIDGALESGIHLFYLRREGIDATTLPYGKHEVGRMEAVFAWLGAELGKDGFGEDLGLPEVSLLCCLDWLDFREVYPTAKHDDLFGPLRAAYRERQSLAETRPVVT